MLLPCYASAEPLVCMSFVASIQFKKDFSDDAWNHPMGLFSKGTRKRLFLNSSDGTGVGLLCCYHLPLVSIFRIPETVQCRCCGYRRCSNDSKDSSPQSPATCHGLSVLRLGWILCHGNHMLYTDTPKTQIWASDSLDSELTTPRSDEAIDIL